MKKLNDAAEQRYFDEESEVSIDEVISRLADMSDNYDLLSSFKGYCEELHPKCFITTDGNTITFTWCTLDGGKVKGSKDVCIINPKARTVKLIPSKENGAIEELDGKSSITLKFTDEFIEVLEEHSKRWKNEDGESLPLPPLAKKKEAKITFELPVITVKKGKVTPAIDEFYAYRYCPGNGESEWCVHTPRKGCIVVSTYNAGDKYTMTFDTHREAVVAACKMVLKRIQIDGASFKGNEQKDFKLTSVEQAVYLYEKEKQGGDSETYTCCVYEPVTDSKKLYKAIVEGNVDFVKLCLDNGANPLNAVLNEKGRTRNPKDTAKENKQTAVLKLLDEYTRS